MAVWISPVIEYIVREAHKDMGNTYAERVPGGLTLYHTLAPALEDQTLLPRMPGMMWNEGQVDLEHTMTTQGAQINTLFEVQIQSEDRIFVSRALYDFENAIIGTVDSNYAPAHHNIAGFKITQADLNLHNGEFGSMADRYGTKLLPPDDPDGPVNGASRGRPGASDSEWFLTHKVERMTVENWSMTYDGPNSRWRGRLMIRARISNTGIYEA